MGTEAGGDSVPITRGAFLGELRATGLSVVWTGDQSNSRLTHPPSHDETRDEEQHNSELTN